MARRLLIVDDALFMRMMIRDAAVSAGWEVVGEAANGEEGFEKFKQTLPDLVTLDLVMPVQGGIDTLKRILALKPDARVVVVSALDQKEVLVESIRHGAADFIVKPFEKERIHSILEQTESLAAGESALSSSGKSDR